MHNYIQLFQWTNLMNYSVSQPDYNNCCTVSKASISSYFLHRKNLDSLDFVHLQL